GVEIDRHKIVLERPIKDTGEHEVTIKLHHDVTAQFSFLVKSAEAPKAEEPAEHTEKKHRSFFRRNKES
ncbi:MAG: 50S ribosomal protein L9, partial [Verrucomicrobiota bacterium]|nr:50S ribosomal protein L9 [Verrucomicrobiota bacterium]